MPEIIGQLNKKTTSSTFCINTDQWKIH